MKTMKLNIPRKVVWSVATLLLTYLVACSQTKEYISESSDDHNASPYFMVLSEEGETENLPLKSTIVNAKINGVIANVNVKQVYTNTGKSPIEAIYVFPASSRAAVYGMVMTIDDREIIAIVEEKQKARNMYETARQEGKIASLLEEHRPNVFQMNVANIMPGQSIEVDLSYTELLVPTNKVYEFMYPTVVGPRYTSKGEIESQTAENWTANPYLKEGELPPSTLDIKVELLAGMPIQDMRCGTHQHDLKYTNKSTAVLQMTEKDGGNRDFILNYRLAGGAIQSGVLTYQDDSGENYFLAMMQPSTTPGNESIPPREYVFIVDVSGSMSGFPLDVSKELMKDLLSNLKLEDKFNIIFFAGSASVYAKESLPATEKNISDAINFMTNSRGGGGTELLNALKTAMTLNTSDQYARSFLILTDGYVSVEKQTFDYIRNNLGNANFFSFGIGSSVNRFLIEGMAHVGYGEPFIALNKSEAKKQAKKFKKYISSPALTNIKFNFNGFEAYDVLPEQMPDLFAERPLIISGKFRGTPNGTLNITGTSGSKPYQKNFDMAKAHKTKGNALKYLWAREKVRLLADYNNLRSNDELRNEIIELGKKYNLLTEYTSFVAIDSEISNVNQNLTTVKQPLPLPQGVSNLAVSRSLAPLKSSNGKRYKKEAVQSVDFETSEDMVVIEFEEEKPENEVFLIAEQMPQFNNGDITEFQKYLLQNLKIPESLNGVSLVGRVFIQFSINKNGTVEEVKIIRGLHPELDKAILKLVEESPKWTPGKQNGKTIKIQQTLALPIKI